MRSPFQKGLLAFAASALVACGGGSSSSSPGATTRPLSVVLLEPANGTISSTRSITVRARVTSDDGGGVGGLVVDVGGLRGRVAGDGSVELAAFPLRDGTHRVRINVLDGGAVAATDFANVTWTRPTEARATIDGASGGDLTVVDPLSPVFGAALLVPAGAVAGELEAWIAHDPTRVPEVPFRMAAVGLAVTVGPLSTAFASDAQIRVPVEPSKMPFGTGPSDLELLAWGDDGWESVPILGRTATEITIRTSDLGRGPFVPVVEVPFGVGELRVRSRPAHALVTLDGVATGLRTPASFPGLDSGEHAIRLRLPGHDDVADVGTIGPFGQGASLDLELERTDVTVAPVVEWLGGIFDGLVVNESVLRIVAGVSQAGAPVEDVLGFVSVNGFDSELVVGAGGFLDERVSLVPGENLLQLRVPDAAGRMGESEVVRVQFDPLVPMGTSPYGVLTAVLTWDRPGVDLDLHVFDPNGGHAWAGVPGGVLGAALDPIDSDGYGPEIFTQLVPRFGEYAFRVDSFDLGTESAATATLRISAGRQVVFQESYRFTSDDANATNGQPAGADVDAFWDAAAPVIRPFRLGLVELDGSSCAGDGLVGGRSFTTDIAEGILRVETIAPGSVLGPSIEYRVRESTRGHTIDTSGLVGRSVTIPLTAGAPIAPNLPLEVVVEAVYFDTDLGADVVTDAVVVRQDLRSTLRQEYVDELVVSPGGGLPLPACERLVDASEFDAPLAGVVPFDVLAGFSSGGPGLAIIDGAADVLSSLESVWPGRLRVVAAWRNPARAASLPGGSPSDDLVTGDAVDLGPRLDREGWPAGATTYDEALRLLAIRAQNQLGDEAPEIEVGSDYVRFQRP